MPVEFLTEERKSQYGKFFGEPNETQLARYFHLDETDLILISKKRGDQNKLGFAIQLTSVRFLGTFISDFMLVPANVQAFVAKQLSIRELAVLGYYSQRGPTKREHTAFIRQHYEYREFSEPPWAFRLSRLLYTQAWKNNERPSVMFDSATAWMLENKILLPGASTLSRLIAEIRKRADKRLWKKLSSLPTKEQKAQLKTLFHVPDGQRFSNFDRYRKGPVTISGHAFNEAVERYLELRAFGLHTLDFSSIPPTRLKSLARHSSALSIYKIARMSDNKKTAILMAFVRAFERIALDDALDILDLLITDIAGKAKKRGQKKRLRMVKDLDKSALILAKVCLFILNETIEETALRAGIFAQVSKAKLEQSIATVNNLARPYNDHYYDEMINQYGRVRLFLSHLLNHITFKAAPAGETTIVALQYLAKIGVTRKQFLKNPPLDIITTPWKHLVFDKEGCVSKRGYTLCLLDKLQDSLRRRDVYVEQSDRWSDPRAMHSFSITKQRSPWLKNGAAVK